MLRSLKTQALTVKTKVCCNVKMYNYVNANLCFVMQYGIKVYDLK